MTRAELNKIKEPLRKGVLFDGIDVDDKPTNSQSGMVLSPVVISPTHIGWEFINEAATSDVE